ncbi:MAG: hypothetical protein LBQ41_01085 [Candidatus Ancillula sp.]|jgi:hypothetical protein|nr:hypothetical protein [Candidatus Ancillula sp.]
MNRHSSKNKGALGSLNTKVGVIVGAIVVVVLIAAVVLVTFTVSTTGNNSDNPENWHPSVVVLDDENLSGAMKSRFGFDTFSKDSKYTTNVDATLNALGAEKTSIGVLPYSMVRDILTGDSEFKRLQISDEPDVSYTSDVKSLKYTIPVNIIMKKDKAGDEYEKIVIDYMNHFYGNLNGKSEEDVNTDGYQYPLQSGVYNLLVSPALSEYASRFAVNFQYMTHSNLAMNTQTSADVLKSLDNASDTPSLAILTRALTDAEKEKYVSYTWDLDPLAPIVNVKNTASSIAVEDLAAILSGKEGNFKKLFVYDTTGVEVN